MADHRPLTPSGTTLTAPAGVAFAADGTLYVADTGNDRVLRVAPDGSARALPGPSGGLSGPTGLATAGSTLFVADTGASRVRRDDLTSDAWDVVASEGRAVGQVVAPTGLAVDAAGTALVVADTGGDRLERFSLDGSAAPATVRLGVGVEGPGTVTSDPAGIDCPGDCGQGFTRATVVRLAATPAPGQVFAGWSGACAGTGPCAVTMDGATAVGARFVPAPPAAPAAPTTAAPPVGRPPSQRAPRDRTAPRVTGLRLVPRTLPRTRRGRTRAKATLRLRASEAATLTLTVERVRHRRRIGATVRLAVRGGPARLALPRRLLPRRRGAYRLVVVARDAAGNRAAPRRVAFAVR